MEILGKTHVWGYPIHGARPVRDFLTCVSSLTERLFGARPRNAELIFPILLPMSICIRDPVAGLASSKCV